MHAVKDSAGREELQHTCAARLEFLEKCILQHRGWVKRPPMCHIFIIEIKINHYQ